jgi:hypothetical protein
VSLELMYHRNEQVGWSLDHWDISMTHSFLVQGCSQEWRGLGWCVGVAETVGWWAELVYPGSDDSHLPYSSEAVAPLLSSCPKLLSHPSTILEAVSGTLVWQLLFVVEKPLLYKGDIVPSVCCGFLVAAWSGLGMQR